MAEKEREGGREGVLKFSIQQLLISYMYMYSYSIYIGYYKVVLCFILCKYCCNLIKNFNLCNITHKTQVVRMYM